MSEVSTRTAPVCEHAKLRCGINFYKRLPLRDGGFTLAADNGRYIPSVDVIRKLAQRYVEMRKLIAIVFSVFMVSSIGAFAADTHNCKTGTHWDANKAMCVKDEPAK